MYGKVYGKQDKEAEVERSVMSDMRRLATLYLKYVEECSRFGVSVCDSRDMLRRATYNQLHEAVVTYTTDSRDEIKTGLKNALYYLIKNFSKVIKGYYLVQCKDDQAAEIDKFVTVFEHNKLILFADAKYAINKNRQINLRKPCRLPDEEDVAKLHKYTIKRVQEL
jgi:hypothetical protein